MQVRLTLITAVFETLLYTGLILGWSSLYPVLIKEGFFSELCEKDTNECDQQTESLNLIYSMSTSFSKILNFAIGALIDKKGIWFSRTIFLTLSSFMFVLTAISKSASISWFLYITFPTQAIMGLGLLIVNLQTCNLSTKSRTTLINLLNGSFTSSSVVFLIIKYLYESNISFQSCFYFLAGLSFIFHLRTFMLTPKKHVPFYIPDNYVYGYKQLSIFSNDNKTERTEVLDSTNEENPDEKSLKECLKEKHMWSLCVYFSIVQLVLLYTLGIFNSWIKTKVPTAKVDMYINLLNLLFFSSIFISLIIGFMIELTQKRLLRNLTPEIASIKSIVVTQLVTVLLTILMFAFMLFDNIFVIYVSIFLLPILVSLIYGTFYCYISNRFPSKHFGVINGILQTIGGLVLLLQYPITLLLLRFLKSNFNVILGSFIVLCIIASIHPAYVLITLKKVGKSKLVTRNVPIETKTENCSL